MTSLKSRGLNPFDRESAITLQAVGSAPLTASDDGAAVFLETLTEAYWDNSEHPLQSFVAMVTVSSINFTNEQGTVTFSVAPAADGDLVTIDDGVNTPTVFEFETGGGVSPGNISVDPGATFNDSAANLDAAILTQIGLNTLNVSTSVLTNVVTVINLNKANGSLTETGTNIVAVDFAGLTETYTIDIQTDTTSSFSSPVVVGSIAFNLNTVPEVYNVLLDADTISKLEPNSAYVRYAASLGGSSPSLEFNAFLTLPVH